jgi:hypothetical protein
MFDPSPQRPRRRPPAAATPAAIRAARRRRTVAMSQRIGTRIAISTDTNGPQLERTTLTWTLAASTLTGQPLGRIHHG